MNIEHLKYAIEVEKTGSISRAAENLFMNQPHLSKAIKDLEEHMGIVIFNRTSKGVIPTRDGEEFLLYAKGILEQIREVEDKYKPDVANTGKFNISVPMACYISQAFIEFVKEIGDARSIKIDYRETNSHNAIMNVLNNETNIAVIRYQAIYEKYFLNYFEEKGLCVKPLWDFEYRLIMSVNHPLALEKNIDIYDLEDYIEITHGDFTIPALSVSKAMEIKRTSEKKKEIAVYERENQFQLLKNIHTTYMWTSPTPSNILNEMPLVEKKCNTKDNRYKDVLIYKEGYKLKKQEKMFVKKIIEEISKL